MSPYGGFVEIYVSTPIDVCEQRDRKGLYAKARIGLIEQFTGISDPYEAPVQPDFEVDPQSCTPDEAVQAVMLRLHQLGYVKAEASGWSAGSAQDSEELRAPANASPTPLRAQEAVGN